MVNKKNLIIFLACELVGILLIIISFFIKYTVKIPPDTPIQEAIAIYHLLLFSDDLFSASLILFGFAAAYIAWAKNKNN